MFTFLETSVYYFRPWLMTGNESSGEKQQREGADHTVGTAEGRRGITVGTAERGGVGSHTV